MAGSSITRAQAAGRLQECIDLLHGRLVVYLLSIIDQAGLDFYQKQYLHDEVQRIDADFSALTLFVARDHWNDLFVAHYGGCPQGLRSLMRRAKDIRNAVSHQKFHVANYEHALQTLAKVATIIGEHDVARDIQSKTSVPPTLDTWERLKVEGDVFLKQEKWTEAMNSYTQALQSNQNHPELYANRASCELKLSMYQLAREDAEDAIELDSSKVTYHHILSEALMALQLHREANAACIEGLKIDPRDEILLVRKRDCNALNMAQIYRVNNPRAIEPETSQYSDFLSKMEAHNVTPIPCDSEIEDIIDFQSVVRSSGLMIEVKRLYKLQKPELETQIVEMCEEAARLGNAEALYNLGVTYSEGSYGGLLRDFTRTLVYYEKAASQKPYCRFSNIVLPNSGVAEAENGLGVVYRDGQGRDADEKKATQYFRRSAEHGCAEGQNNFGLALFTGAGITKNATLARGWFAKGAEKNIPEAQINYADLLADGIGGSVNIEQAIDFYRRAADQGHPDAYKKIQELQSRTGRRVTRTAIVDLTNTNVNVLMLTASNYARGEGDLDKDMNQALQYYRSAADRGHLEAEWELAQLLLEHFKHNTEGFAYMKRAAEKGHTLAQWHLGQLLAFGHGCERNEDEAQRWLTRAKRHGFEIKSSIKTDTKFTLDLNVDNELEMGKFLCESEKNHQDLSTEGLTIKDRVYRQINQMRPPHIPKLLSMPTGRDFTSIPFAYCLTNNVVFCEVERRAKTGSLTAQKYMKGYATLNDALTKISESSTESLRLFRIAFQLCERLPPLPVFHRVAQFCLLNNPHDADALYVTARTVRRSNRERMLFLENCVQLHPLVADFHNMLASMYMLENEYHKAQRTISRALELEYDPEYLYTQVSAIKFANDNRQAIQLFELNKTYSHNPHGKKSKIEKDKKKILASNLDDIIIKYNRFLELNPIDHKKVPITLYTLASLHMLRDEEQLTRDYWHKAQAADHPKTRLPCHEPVPDFFEPKQMVKTWIIANDHTSKLSCTENESQSSSLRPIIDQKQQPTCDQCGKINPSKHCPCEKVNYCDKNCQMAHWPLHKKTDEHKKIVV